MSQADAGDAASMSGLSLVSSSLPQRTGQAPMQLVGLLSENRDLLDKLAAMHSKLKLARARLAQREQELRSAQAEVGRGTAQRQRKAHTLQTAAVNVCRLSCHYLRPECRVRCLNGPCNRCRLRR